MANFIETKFHDGVRQMLGKEFILTGKIPVELGRFYSVAFSKRSAWNFTLKPNDSSNVSRSC